MAAHAKKSKEEIKMGMLSTMFGNGAAPTAVQVATPAAQVAAQVAQTPPPKPAAVIAAPAPAAKPLIQDAAPQAQIPASACVQKQQYRVNGIDSTFLCLTTFGADQYASFTPLAGGSPILVPPTTLVGAFVTPAEVKPAVAIIVAQPAAPAAIQTAAPAEAPKRRGRPSKPPAAPTTAAPVNPVQTDENLTSGVFVYMNCTPVGVQTQGLGAYVEELQEALYDAVKKGDPTFTPPGDIRLAEGNAIGFGKWKAYLAGACADSLPAPGHYLSLQGDEREAVIVAALLKVLEPGHVVIG